MNIRQIDEINHRVRTNRRNPFYDVQKTNWRGCFVGNLKEWEYFQAENKENAEKCSRYEFTLKNGESWTWVSEGKEAYRASRYSRMIVPRRIDFDYFMDKIFIPCGYYCTEIEWYGEPEKFDFY